MVIDPNEVERHEQVLDEILTSYLKAQDAGQKPDRQDLLARYPQLAADLEEFFNEQDKLQRWAEPFLAVARSARLEEPPSGDPNLQSTLTEGVDPLTVLAGRNFGEYELLEPIARGGMGVVFKARDRRLNRLVALKMILAGSLASFTELQRFRNEAEAAALLDHPHIVPIFEVGEWQDQAYISMKLIEGGSLAGQLSRFTANPKAAARLMIAVARAVHHGHLRGILHRDLKPSNVLLDGQGQPHVTDFGLAKRVAVGAQPEFLELTQSGAILGTPGFMAPEQATGRKGGVTTVTDVYGLGAILYSLLTGHAPFRGDSVLDTLEQVKNQDPEPPRKSNQAVDRDLELICLKCLEKEPPRRYSSGEELAEELECYLEGKPLGRTRPVGAMERSWRWYRRNRLLASLAAGIALLVLTVAVVATVASFRLKAANDRERQSRQRAEDNLKVARSTIESFTKVSEDKRLRARGLERLQRDMRRQAKDFYEQLVQQQTDNPDLEAERGRAYLRLAQLTNLLGSQREAIGLFQQAQAIFEQLHGDHPEVADYEDGLAQALLEQGSLFQFTKQWQKARSTGEMALAIRERLARDHPEMTEYQDRLARAVHNLARLYQVTDQTAQARQAYGQVLTLFQQLVQDHANQPTYRDLLARTHLNLGTAFLNASHTALEQTPADFDKAREHYQEAVVLFKQLTGEQPQVPEWAYHLAEAQHLLGTLYRRAGKLQEAATIYDNALSIIWPLTHDHADIPDYRFLKASLLHARGYAALLQEQFDQAGAFYERALAVSEPLAQQFPEIATYQEELGRTCYDSACLAGFLAAAVSKDAKLSVAERDRRIEDYCQVAVEHLRKSWNTGFLKNPAVLAHLKKDPDLAPFSGCAAFQKLVGDFEEELRRNRQPTNP